MSENVRKRRRRKDGVEQRKGQLPLARSGGLRLNICTGVPRVLVIPLLMVCLLNQDRFAGPMIEPSLQTILPYAALGTGCTLTEVPRSTQPSTLRGTKKRVSTSWMSVIIQMAMGECIAFSSVGLHAASKVVFAALPTSSHSFK